MTSRLVYRLLHSAGELLGWTETVADVRGNGGVMIEWTIDSIRIAVARSGRDPEYGDEFWKASGPAAAAFLLGVIDGRHAKSAVHWALVDGRPTRVQPTYPAEPF